jgi:hypothetical protein
VIYNGKKSPKINSNTANNFSSDAGKQLLIANERNRVRWLVIGLSQDGACMDLYENHSENSLKVDLSNDATVSQPTSFLIGQYL